MLIGFVIADMIWYGKTGFAFVDSKYLFWGTISTGLISAVFYISYLVQAKKHKDLKQFFLGIIIAIVVIYLFGFLVVKL